MMSGQAIWYMNNVAARVGDGHILCPGCAEKRWGPGEDFTVDFEGELGHEYCDDCGQMIDEGPYEEPSECVAGDEALPHYPVLWSEKLVCGAAVSIGTNGGGLMELSIRGVSAKNCSVRTDGSRVSLNIHVWADDLECLILNYRAWKASK